MYAALKQGTVRKIFTGGNAVVWPERFRKVGYYYEMDKEVFKLKSQGKVLMNSLEHMFREEVVPLQGDNKEWDEVIAWPKLVADFEGDFVVECYVALFLTRRFMY